MTGLKTSIIKSYNEHCNETGSSKLSDNSLLKIINAIKPSFRKQLSGLDNFMVDGLEDLKTLKEITRKVFDRNESKSIEHNLGVIEVYLKTNFSIHCREESNCISHCTCCALSDPIDTCFQRICPPENHTGVCDNCNLIIDILEEIDSQVKANGSEEDLYEFELSKSYLLSWQKHIIRGHHQNLSKTDVVKILSEKNVLWIRDFGQKINPQDYREAQKNYFGKNGYTTHNDVFLLKVNSQIKKMVFITIVEKSDQDSTDALIIGDLALKAFKKKFPHALNIFHRSDNAMCYSSNLYIQTLPTVVKNNKLTLKRIDYSEPQKGKDEADRVAAVTKRKVKTFIQNGNSVTSGSDLKQAICFQDPPKNTTVAVCEISKTKNNLIINPIKDVSKIHSIYFQTTIKITYHNYYKIGCGRTITLKNYDLQGSCIVKEVSVSSLNESLPSIEHPQLKLQNILFCSNELCDSTFSTQKDLEDHELCGDHSIISIKTSTDAVKLYLKQRIASSTADSNSVMDSTVNNINMSQNQFYKSSWAIEKRKSGRLDADSKKFIVQLFIQGEETGRKVSPKAACDLIKKKLDENGEPVFDKSQFLKVSQIQSLFSRLSSAKNKGKISLDSLKEANGFDIEPALIQVKIAFKIFFENILLSLKRRKENLKFKF